MRLLILSSLVFGIACGDDDITTDTGPIMMDGGMPDVPGIPDGGDPCTGIVQCTAGATCAGDTLTVCAADVNGCLVPTETDCTTVAGATCDDSGAVAMCTSDPCMGVSDCAAEARTCTDDTLTVCAPDAMGCLVNTATDCTVDGTTCDDTGAMAMCIDACDGVTDCAAESRSCDMDSLVVCAPDAAGCLVETTTDCAAMMGASCDATVDPIACVAPVCPPADASGIVLNCATGTISGTTMGGTDSLDTYCGLGGTGYDGAEVVYAFGDAQSATVTITVVSGTPAADLDMDLFVIDGGDGTVACAADTTCLDRSRGGTTTEEVSFDYLPGSTNYVAYDAWQDSALTTDFMLTVSCEVATCGDSMISGPEVCDDGNAAAMDGCSDLCQVETGYLCTEDGAGLSTCVLSCGDSVVNGEDECDDGGLVAGDGCSDTCTVEAGYACTEDGAGLSTCELSCGNGTVDGMDECDDDNMMAGDGCSATCTIETGYVCTEDGAGLSTCDLSCGDGVINGADECDDDNTVAGDGCSDTCTVEATYACYDEPSVCRVALESFAGVLEVTDTEWNRPNESCGSTSFENRFEAVTYTNSTAAGQFVDVLATHNGYDGYVHIYSGAVDPADPTVGCLVGDDDFNGFGFSYVEGYPVPAGESITIVVSPYDAPPSAPDNTFAVDVFESAYADCGGGTLEGLEACDDGANANGDGCSDVCTVEAGFGCGGEPSVCEVSICGNSMVELGEVCDDGNVMGGDGCEADCRSAVFSGALEMTDPQWERPGSFSDRCSAGAVGSTMYYDVQQFTWNGAADTALTFTIAWTDVDGYVHAFSEPFDASTSPAGCLDGGDDFGGTSGSQVIIDTVTPAQVINTVMSTYDEDDTGAWTLTITR